MRISSLDGNPEKVEEKVKELFKLIPDAIFGKENQTMGEVVGKLLLDQKKILSLAESCTGGYTSHLITAEVGSSAYYEGSIICYSYNIKEMELNVPHQTLATKGAVSEEIVDILSLEIQKKYKTDYAVAISGIAGPGGGTPDKPVGTVWISVRNKKTVVSKKFNFGSNRQRNIEQSALSALNMLRLLLLKQQ